MSGLMLSPIRLKAAAAFVGQHHRHARPPIGGLFAVGLQLDGIVVGVGIAGRPVARMLDDGRTVEITRVCTTGHRNACSMIYAALCRAAKSLGYVKAITYTLTTESGTSLQASGFDLLAKVDAKSWSCPSRPRVDWVAPKEKFRWERRL